MAGLKNNTLSLVTRQGFPSDAIILPVKKYNV